MLNSIDLESCEVKMNCAQLKSSLESFGITVCGKHTKIDSQVILKMKQIEAEGEPALLAFEKLRSDKAVVADDSNDRPWMICFSGGEYFDYMFGGDSSRTDKLSSSSEDWLTDCEKWRGMYHISLDNNFEGHKMCLYITSSSVYTLSTYGGVSKVKFARFKRKEYWQLLRELYGENVTFPTYENYMKPLGFDLSDLKEILHELKPAFDDFISEYGLRFDSFSFNFNDRPVFELSVPVNNFNYGTKHRATKMPFIWNETSRYVMKPVKPITALESCSSYQEQ